MSLNHAVPPPSQITDIYRQFTQRLTPLGQQIIVEPFRLVGTTFSSSIDANFWAATASGTGAASGVASGLATLSSGTSNNGYGQMASVRTARFNFAALNMYRSSIRLPATTAALNTRRWGAFSVSSQTPQNGVYFEVSAAGVLSVVSVSNGTPTAISSGSFNGAVTTYTMDTNVHAYEIMYFTMGAWFYIDGVLIHKITPTASVLYQSITVPLMITTINGGAGVTAGVIECFNQAILRLSQTSTESIYKNITGNAATYVLKLNAGKIHKLIFNNTSGTSLTIYDNTSAAAPVIGTITTTASALGVWNVGIPFFTGLTIVTTGNNLDLTVIYE